MGALVACYAARAHQDWFNGLIITSPAMDVDKNLTLKIQSLFGAPLEALAPWARLVPAVVVDDLSESEEVCDLSAATGASRTADSFKPVACNSYRTAQEFLCRFSQIHVRRQRHCL